MSTKSGKQSNRNVRRRRAQKARKQQVTKQPLIPERKFYNIKKLVIGDCTRMYGRALVNPFADFKIQPCIPDTIAMASYKITCRTRGVFSTGANGVGFVALNPFTGLIRDAATGAHGHDQNCVYTLPSYNGSNFYIDPVASLGSQNLGAANSTSHFTASEFNNNIEMQMRLVGAGIKVRYVGSSFRNQGRVLLTRSPGNTGYTIPMAGGDFLQFLTNRSVPVARGEEYVYYVPDHPNLLGYATLINYLPSLSTTTLDRRSLIIYIDGGDVTTPQSWEFDAVMHYEVIGPGLTQTMSSSDVEGMGAVLSSVSGSVPASSPDKVENTLWQKVAAAFDKETTRMIEGAVQTGVRSAAFAGAAYLTARARGTAPIMIGGPTVTDV